METLENPKLVKFLARDGLKLAGFVYGSNNHDPYPVVCLPGLTRTSHDFDLLAQYLSSEAGGQRKVICLDYRGRGASAYDNDWRNYSLPIEIDDLIAALSVFGLHHIDLIGTSRGGLLAMLMAAVRPGVLNSVVLNDIGPEIEPTGLMRIKNSIEKQAIPSNIEEAADYLQRIHGQQFTAFGPSDWARHAQLSFAQDQDGSIAARYDPRLVKTMQSINIEERIPDMWPQFAGLTNIPTLVLRGENSDILSRQTTQKMQEIHSKLRLVEIPGQGHAPDVGFGEIPKQIAGFLSA